MKKQGFFLGSVILVASVLITKILGLVYKIPLANMVGGTGMGYYSVAFTVFMPVYAVAVSGVPSAMARMTAENMAFGRYRNARKLRRVALVFFTGMGALFSLVLIALAYPLCKYVVNEPKALLSVIAVAPSVLIGAVISVERGYIEGMRNMIPTAVSEIIESLFKVILGLGFAYAAIKYGMQSYYADGSLFFSAPANSNEAKIVVIPYAVAASVLGITIAHAISCGYVVLSLRLGGDGITPQMLEADPVTDRMRVLLRRLLLLVLPIAVASVISTLTSMVDLVSINRCLKQAFEADYTAMMRQYGGAVNETTTSAMLPHFIYGSYTGLAMTVFGLVPSLTAMFGKSVLPGVSESWAVKDTMRLRKNINAVLFAVMLLALPCGMVISVLSREILQLLFGGRPAEVAASVLPLSVLGVGVIFLCLASPVFAVLQAIGRPDLPVRITIAAGVAKLVVNFLLIPLPELNITGAAIATTLMYAVISIWSLVEILRLTKIRIDFAKIFVKPAFAALLSAGTAFLVNEFTKDLIGNSFRLLFSVFASGIIYIISLVLLSVLTKKEVKALFFR